MSVKKTSQKILKWILLFCFFFVLFLLIPKTVKEPEVRGWAKPLLIPSDASSFSEKDNP